VEDNGDGVNGVGGYVEEVLKYVDIFGVSGARNWKIDTW